MADSERDAIMTEQRHRDAAADYLDTTPPLGWGNEIIRDGIDDDHALVQAFVQFEARLIAKLQSEEAKETLESIITWGDVTFGPCSQERAIDRAGEEWAEMEEPDADVLIEAADVIICLLRIPGILEAINRKMGINRDRVWDVRPDGTGYHVKATAALAAGVELLGGETPTTDRAEVLREALQAVRDDLIKRALWEGPDEPVAVGTSVWLQIVEALATPIGEKT